MCVLLFPLDMLLVQREAVTCCSLRHPYESEVGQAGIGIPPTHVRVNASEPRLLYHLMIDSMALESIFYSGFAPPDRRRKESTLLIDGERLIRVGNVVAEVRVVKSVLPAPDPAERTKGHAHGPHGIPDADELDTRPPPNGCEPLLLFLRALWWRCAVVLPSLKKPVHVPLLEKRHMDRFLEAWEYYRTPPPKRTKEQEERFASIRRRARIELIGVWDTVGTMGVPFGPLRWIGRRKYRFHNTNLGDNVAHAYQALAIDEQRRFFAPTVWRREPGIENRLKGHGID